MFTQHDKISFIALSTALYCMSHDVNDSIRVLHDYRIRAFQDYNMNTRPSQDYCLSP